MDDHGAARRIGDLRRFRTRPPRDTGAAPEFTATARELARLQKRLGGVGQAWESVCPPALAPRTAVEGVARGVLTIRVADAATKYELDRRLRAGAERDLIRLSPAGVRKVKLVIGEVARP